MTTRSPLTEIKALREYLSALKGPFVINGADPRLVEFVKKVNPQTLLALLDETERLKRRADDLEETLECVTEERDNRQRELDSIYSNALRSTE